MARTPSRAMQWLMLCVGTLSISSEALATAVDVPTPQVWPTRFKALLFQNFSDQLGVMDWWYDWSKGGHLHVIQNQLAGAPSYDVEWSNGTSFLYDLDAQTCTTMNVGVGILRPDWLHSATYVGVREMDGFTCDVWEKSDFITYYEDRETKRPVYWEFYTGRQVHAIKFEEGGFLEEARWQAPAYCFTDEQTVMPNLPRSKASVLTEYKEWLLSGGMSA